MRSLAGLSRAARGLRCYSQKAEGSTDAAKQSAEQVKEALNEHLSAAQNLARGTFTELLKDVGIGGAKKADDEKQGGEKEGSKKEGGEKEGGEKEGGEKGAKEGGESASSSSSSSSSSEDASSSSFASRVSGFARSAVREIQLTLSSDVPGGAASALRGASAKAGAVETSSETALAHLPGQSSSSSGSEEGWRAAFAGASEKLRTHPFFQRLRESEAVAKGRDVAGQIRERWETSDSPLVHRIQDATDAWMQESEGAKALREIRARDRDFDVVVFLARVRADVRPVIESYLKGEEAVLTPFCTPEMAERLTGILRATAAAGLVPDPTLIDVSDVELVDLKLAEDDSPVAVVQFTAQQINCTRDSYGNVVEGGAEDVQRVYYYWALEQEREPYVGEDGNVHPPRWKLKEMLIRGMHHLL